VRFGAPPGSTAAAGEAAGVASGMPPEVRCFGRVSVQPVAVTAPPPGAATPGARRTSHTTATASQAGSSAGGQGGGGSGSVTDGRHSFTKVGEPTAALACAGQLSLIVRSPASALAAAGGSSSSSNSGGLPAPCHFRCEGLCFKIERVGSSSAAVSSSTAPAASSAASAAASAAAANANAATTTTTDGSPTAASTGSRAQGEGQRPATAAPAAAEPTADSWPGEETAQAALKTAQAVVGKAQIIVQSLGGAAQGANSGPGKIATDMVAHSQKICQQAGKIVARSAQQLGQLATLPLRLRDGGGEAADGGEGRPGMG